MFPDMVDLTPFREVFKGEDAGQIFFLSIDLGAPWAKWLPHLRAIDELLPTPNVQAHVVKLVRDFDNSSSGDGLKTPHSVSVRR